MYGRAGQVTDDKIIWRMRVACWKRKPTDTHSEYVILLFNGDSGYANAPQCYVCTYGACFVLNYFETDVRVVGYKDVRVVGCA